jgi:hypothetical protein
MLPILAESGGVRAMFGVDLEPWQLEALRERCRLGAARDSKNPVRRDQFRRFWPDLSGR